MEYTALTQQQNIFLAFAILLSSQYAKNSTGLAASTYQTGIKASNLRAQPTVLQSKHLTAREWYAALCVMEGHIQEYGMQPLSEDDKNSILSYLKHRCD